MYGQISLLLVITSQLLYVHSLP